jgi:hypothetical protein
MGEAAVCDKKKGKRRKKGRARRRERRKGRKMSGEGEGYPTKGEREKGEKR